jgi:hypothetical protein
LAQAGHDLARQAIGKALEQVDHADAVGDLIRFAHSRRSVLEMAHDYLGWVRFDAPLSAQVDALFLVDRALYELEHPATAANPVVTALRARAGRVRAALHRRRAAHHRGAPRVA